MSVLYIKKADEGLTLSFSSNIFCLRHANIGYSFFINRLKVHIPIDRGNKFLKYDIKLVHQKQ